MPDDTLGPAAERESLVDMGRVEIAGDLAEQGDSVCPVPDRSVNASGLPLLAMVVVWECADRRVRFGRLESKGVSGLCRSTVSLLTVIPAGTPE